MSEAQDIRELALIGLGWTATSRLFQQALQFGFNIALARLLFPHDFGLIAMIAVFTGFAAVFVDFGLTYAIVQRTNVQERHLSTAFWLNVGMGAGLMLMIIALAPAIAAFYAEPQLVGLTAALAPTFLVRSLAGVQAAILQREMNFRRFTLIENVGAVGGNALALGMALSGFGVWSLIGLSLAPALITTSLLWGFSAWRPRVRPDRATFNELWTFSSRLTGFNAVNYWARNADNLLIGRFVGTSQLGIYTRAYSLMLLPLETTSAVATPVMYASLSRLKDDHERVKRVYLRALAMITLVMFPAIVGLFVLSEPFILTIYGSKWAEVAPVLQILCVASLLQTLSFTTGWIFTSQGRTDWLLRYGFVSSITAICSFFLGLNWGLRGIAIAYTSWTFIMVYLAFTIIERMISLRIVTVMRAVAGPFVSAIMMGVIVWIIVDQASDDWADIWRLAMGVSLGVVTYSLCLRIVSPNTYHEFVDLMKHYLRRRNGALTAR